jgi:hypothetical membrane protein
MRAGRSLLCACGPLAALAFLAADLAGIRATPGYSVTGQAISDLMEKGAPAKRIVDPLLVLSHGLVPPFALGLRRVTGARLGPALLAGAGATGVILTLAFPCDPGCAPFVSLTGTLHIFLAVPMGFAILFALVAFARHFRRAPGWRRFAPYSAASAAAGLALAVATLAAAETALVGLLERALTASYLQGYAVLGLVAARRAT